jgi:hypothetical protein
MVIGLQHAKVGFVVFLAIILPGAFLLRDASDAAIQAVGAVAFIAGCAVNIGLSIRAERQKENHPQ